MSDNPGWAAWRHNFNVAHVAYIQALLELSHCNGMAQHSSPANCHGEDCDQNLHYLGYEPDDITPSAAREIDEDLHGFVTSCLSERPDCFADVSPDMVGYDFYMTRNGHGVGFWDRGLGEMGDWLTAMCKPFGEASVYVGDNGSLYYWNS